MAAHLRAAAVEVCVEFCPRRSGPAHLSLRWVGSSCYIYQCLSTNLKSIFEILRMTTPLSYGTFQTSFSEDKIDGSWSRLNRYPEPQRLKDVFSGYRLQTSKNTDLKVAWIGGVSTSHLIAAYGALTSRVKLCDRIISWMLWAVPSCFRNGKQQTVIRKLQRCLKNVPSLWSSVGW